VATAGTVLQLIAGRLVIGLSGSASAAVVPTFLAEMAPPALQGLTVTLYECMICIVMLASLLIDAVLEVCSHCVISTRVCTHSGPIACFHLLVLRWWLRWHF
jgi:MFS family permease